MCLNETCSKARIVKHLSNNFPIQNDLKHEDSLKPLFFNFAVAHAIRKVHQNQAGFKLNWTDEVLAYAVDLNLLGDNIIPQRKTQRL
jgi:hypothetical protein